MSTESQIIQKARVNFTRTTYKLLEQHLKEKFDEELLESFLSEMCIALKFDPSKSTYDEDAAQSIRAYREKKKAEGISTYVSSGMKKVYEKRRQKTT